MDKFVVLRSDDIDMEEFVEAFILYLKSGETTRQEERIQLDNKLLSDILHSMDSEWDKNIVRVLIGSIRSNIAHSDTKSTLALEMKHEKKKIQRVDMPPTVWTLRLCNYGQICCFKI